MPEVIVLHFLHQHLLALAVERQVEQVGAVVEVADQFLLGKRDGDDGLLVAVDDAGDEPGVAQPLVGPRAQFAARLGGDLMRFGLPWLTPVDQLLSC